MSRPTDLRLDPPDEVEKGLTEELIDAVDALLTRCKYLGQNDGIPESLKPQLLHLAIIRDEMTADEPPEYDDLVDIKQRDEWVTKNTDVGCCDG
jgi:hypothetical protein